MDKMLRRQSMKSRPDLRHRKSTSSARSVVLEHLDPAMAQRDARTAAHQAFASAQDRSSLEVPVFPPQSSPTRTATLYNGTGQRGQNHPNSGDPSIPRRQSVRFVGPCTVTGKGQPSQGQRGRASTLQGPLDPVEYATIADTSALTIHAPQPRPGTSLSTNSSTIVGGYVQALMIGQEVYDGENESASAASSHHRLRRSQSMFPPKQGGLPRHSEEAEVESLRSALRTTGPPLLPPLDLQDNQQAKENVRPPKTPALRAPKSMSFLRGRHERTSSITSYQSSGTAPKATHERAPLRSKPSLFFGSRSRRGGSGLQKTLRSSSSNAELTVLSPEAQAGLPRNVGLRIKARKASRSLKDKFKNLFVSTKGDDDAGFPDQHVKSQKSHITSGFCPLDHDLDAEQAVLDYLEQTTGAQAGDEKSRVTSWTNSGPSTLTSEQRLAWREWEKQRLSVIKENGAHRPSPSLQRKAIGQHILQSQESLLGRPIQPGPTIDSQRVYAALMQRLEDTKQLTETAVPPAHGDITRTKADFEEYEDHSAKPAPLLVRRVTSAGSTTVSQSGLHGEGIPRLGASAHPDYTAIQTPADLYTLAKDPWAEQDYSQSKVVSDHTSAFFGGPDAHLFRTESSYRCALRKSMEEAEIEAGPKQYAESRVVSDCMTEIRRPQNIDDVYEADYTESVYSDDEEQRGERAVDPMTPIVESPINGTTLPAANRPNDPTVVQPITINRVNSSVSSVDWKTWLSANVAKLQPSPSPTHYSEIGYTGPTMPGVPGNRHVREWAQIEIESEQTTPVASPAQHNPTLHVSPSKPTEAEMTKGSPVNHNASVTSRTQHYGGILAPIDNLPDRPVSSRDVMHFPDFGSPPGIPQRSPMRNSAYRPSLASAKSTSQLRQGKKTESTQSHGEERSLSHIRSVNQLAYATNTSLGSPQTPGTRARGLKLQKKRSGFLYSPSVASSSPGLTAAVERQFGPAAKRHNTRNEEEGKENKMTPAAKLFTPDAEVRSARNKMVDVFLSSRRKRMASSSDGNAGRDESGAFI